MNSYDKGRYADLLLQALKSGRKFNNNQIDMLIALGIHPDDERDDIESQLMVQIAKNPPENCVMPEY